MYQKILITTDGSAVSRHTACAGVELARQLGARVLVLYAAPPYQYPVYAEVVPPAYPSEDDYLAHMQRIGDDHTSAIVRVAREAGLESDGMTVFADSAATAIVEAADRHNCDLIFIGSHGRSGWGQLLLGSVTNKVLSHTTRPVLVHRLIKEPSS